MSYIKAASMFLDFVFNLEIDWTSFYKLFDIDKPIVDS